VFARPARLAVFISGGGRTLLNIAARIRDGLLAAEIAVVVASGESAGTQRARDAGMVVEVHPGRMNIENLEDLIRRHRIDLVVLAGYLKLLPIPPSLVGRAVNIHPALLPEFGGPGMHGHHVHEAVLKAGKSVSGCTVHFCDEQFDTGQIIHQRRCPVMPGDTPETLAARVFEQELLAYPEALTQLLADRARITSQSH